MKHVVDISVTDMLSGDVYKASFTVSTPFDHTALIAAVSDVLRIRFDVIGSNNVHATNLPSDSTT